MKMTAKKFEVGDKVSVLDEAINGVVVAIENNDITIETTDGFMMTYFVNELIKENNTNYLGSINTTDTLHKKNIDSTPKKKNNVPTTTNKKEGKKQGKKKKKTGELIKKEKKVQRQRQ